MNAQKAAVFMGHASRLPAVSEPQELDIFERARSVASALMFAAGALLILGSLLDWVTIEPPPFVPADQRELAEPFTGLDAEDGSGWISLTAGAILIPCSMLLFFRSRSLWAWFGFLASIVAGAIAFSNYRNPEELREVSGQADPAFGLTLVTAAALVGVIASVAGITATPHRRM